MSAYTTVEEVREALPLSAATSTADFADLITEISDGFDAILGFSYDGVARTVFLTGDGGSRLMLPRPGAYEHGVMTILESGVLLDPTLYELEQDFGRYIRRLDASGRSTTWSTTERSISVTYVPNRCPASVRNACTKEVVRHFRSQQMGHSRTIGAPGVSQQVYDAGFDTGTIELLERRRQIAGSGGPGWVMM
jgi:hypothetical protein